jgi:hypothetical protein
VSTPDDLRVRYQDTKTYLTIFLHFPFSSSSPTSFSAASALPFSTDRLAPPAASHFRIQVGHPTKKQREGVSSPVDHPPSQAHSSLTHSPQPAARRILQQLKPHPPIAQRILVDSDNRRVKDSIHHVQLCHHCSKTRPRPVSPAKRLT